MLFFTARYEHVGVYAEHKIKVDVSYFKTACTVPHTIKCLLYTLKEPGRHTSSTLIIHEY